MVLVGVIPVCNWSLLHIFLVFIGKHLFESVICVSSVASKFEGFWLLHVVFYLVEFVVVEHRGLADLTHSSDLNLRLSIFSFKIRHAILL